MKIYNNSEVMMLLKKNPKLRFESKIDGEPIEMYADSLETEEGTLNYICVDSEYGRSRMDGNILVDTNWTLKEQPITWDEVLKSDKKVRVEHELLNKFEGNENHLLFGGVMRNISYWLSTSELRQVIKEGKWYLEN